MHEESAGPTAAHAATTRAAAGAQPPTGAHQVPVLSPCVYSLTACLDQYSLRSLGLLGLCGIPMHNQYRSTKNVKTIQYQRTNFIFDLKHESRVDV